jgi:hypothetical protein
MVWGRVCWQNIFPFTPFTPLHCCRHAPASLRVWEIPPQDSRQCHIIGRAARGPLDAGGLNFSATSPSPLSVRNNGAASFPQPMGGLLVMILCETAKHNFHKEIVSEGNGSIKSTASGSNDSCATEQRLNLSLCSLIASQIINRKLMASLRKVKRSYSLAT